jgi:hypothetical protein
MIGVESELLSSRPLGVNYWFLNFFCGSCHGMSKLWWLIFIASVLLVGCGSDNHEEFSIIDSEYILQVENIEKYLDTVIGISAFGGEVFCAYEPLKTEQGVEDTIFIWALCMEYYLEQDSLMIGSGISLPVALRIQGKNGQYKVIDHLMPRNGTYYGPDVRSIFPPSTWSQIFDYDGSKLEEEAEVRARLHYGIGAP